jgi:hypothetical protein
MFSYELVAVHCVGIYIFKNSKEAKEEFDDWFYTKNKNKIEKIKISDKIEVKLQNVVEYRGEYKNPSGRKNLYSQVRIGNMFIYFNEGWGDTKNKKNGVWTSEKLREICEALKE